MTSKISLDQLKILDVIKDYQETVSKAVNIFKCKYKVNDLLEGWYNRVYQQTGKLIEEGVYFYAFHGIGLEVQFKDKIVDFDFAFFPEPRHDGFDLWRLTIFIQNQRNKYPEYKDKEDIEREFNQLIVNKVIVNPILEYPTTLYFLKSTLELEALD